MLTDACSARALNPYAELKTVCHHRDRGPRSRSSEEVLNKAVQRTLKDGGQGKRRHDAEVVDGVGARETAVFAVVKPLGEDLITTDLMELEIGGDAIKVLGRVDVDPPTVDAESNNLPDRYLKDYVTPERTAAILDNAPVPHVRTCKIERVHALTCLAHPIGTKRLRRNAAAG